MTLVAGARLGPYEIVSSIGAGGMGEVYRARDTRLERTVAVKVLPAHFADAPERRARFEREARAVSSLNHPHICTLHDVGHQDGIDFLVMEYLEGETLADRLKKGPLPTDAVLRYGIQIADALDKAHRQGVVHRDLKPANVMLTKSGAKLLDFGLAKLKGPEMSAGSMLSALPTGEKPLTEAGTLLGTFQYMAPEQLEGRDADARTDIFAFGAVVYEMATGRRAFEGKSQASLIAAILEHEPPPITTLQPMTPPALDRVVRTCLAKDPDERWQNAHDLTAELKWIAAGASEAGMPATVVERRRRSERGWMAATALMVVALMALALAYLRRAPAEPVPVRLSLARPAAAPYEYFDSAALSPDGRRVAFVSYTADAKTVLWLRPLDALAARPLPGSEGASMPFWSPDSRSLGFFAEGKLKRIDAGGGPPQVLCEAPSPRGGAWGREGVIVFASSEAGLYRVPATGGTRATATRLLPREEAHRWPAFLPDGHHFVFLGDAAKTEDHFLRIGSLDSEDSRDLMGAVTNAVYAPPGYLLFVRGRSLLAQPFDAKHLRLTGEPVALAEALVESAGNHRFEFSVSDTGLLTYRSANLDRQLTWIDRSGRRLASVGDPGRTAYVELSPDQRRVAFVTEDQDGRDADIWIRDLARGLTSRLTFDPASDSSPVWSPDGSRIAFRSMRTGLGDLYQKSATNPGEEELLFKSAETASPVSWSPDGRFLLFEVYAASANTDLWLLPLATPAKPEPFLKTSFDENSPQFSRDGRWVAYASDESGRSEVYVRAFPASSTKWQVSTGGGWRPRWRRDGRELFYLTAVGRLMAVSVQAAGRFEASDPRELFRVQAGDYDVAADGQRFLVAVETEDLSASPITVVLNWTAGLAH